MLPDRLTGDPALPANLHDADRAAAEVLDRLNDVPLRFSDNRSAWRRFVLVALYGALQERDLRLEIVGAVQHWAQPFARAIASVMVSVASA